MLDNAVWHAIDGPCSALADRVGLAGRFHRDVSPFSAIADDRDPAAWDDLATLIGPGHRAVLFTASLDTPDGWEENGRIECLQLVADGVKDTTVSQEFVELGPRDVPAMLELVGATQPGPFHERTIEFGRYIGQRVDDRLVAMAGERIRCSGFTEVSAVCTAADQRGKGLGGALTLAVVDGIRARGDEAFLHVAKTNENALRLYLALGFTVRTEADAVVVGRVPAD